MINSRLDLSVGATPARRTVFAIVGPIFIGIGLVFSGIGVAVSIMAATSSGPFAPDPAFDTPWFREQGPNPDDIFAVAAVPFGAVFALVGLLFAAVALYAMLRNLRTAAWLAGSTVHVRNAWGVRSVDLATAHVTAGTAEQYTSGGPDVTIVWTVPALQARSPLGGRPVVVPLRGMNVARLPSHELRALADAMTAGRGNGPRDAEAHAIARQLYAVAERPLDL